MRKNEKNEKNSKLRSFFGLVPRPEGEFRARAPYPDVLKSLGYRGGGQKWPKNAKIAIKWKKMSKYEKNS